MTIFEIPHNTVVESDIRSQIAANGPLDFASFMDTSLYHEGGYYAEGTCVIGSENEGSDFVTSPEINPAFGATIANFISRAWSAQGRPNIFPIIEMGAGKGTLPKDILDHTQETQPELYKALSYIVIERSAGLIPVQQNSLSNHDNVQWVNASAYNLPLSNIKGGLVLSNELVDAFPFHRLIRENGEVKEIYIGLDANNNFCEIKGQPSDAVNDPTFLDRVPEGRERTVSPLSVKWMKTIGAALKYGNVLTIDYAQNANPLSQVARAYTKATYDTKIDPAIRFPGSVDITSSVDFALLADVGRESGLVPVSRDTQRNFLIKHGFNDEVDRQMRADYGQGDGSNIPHAYQKNYKWRTNALIMGTMGEFEVLVQEKAK